MKVKTVKGGWYLWLEDTTTISAGRQVAAAEVYNPDPDPVGSGNHLVVNMEYYKIEEKEWPVERVVSALADTYKGKELHKKLVEFGIIDKNLK